jgi:hypothetical protein
MASKSLCLQPSNAENPKVDADEMKNTDYVL